MDNIEELFDLRDPLSKINHLVILGPAYKSSNLDQSMCACMRVRAHACARVCVCVWCWLHVRHLEILCVNHPIVNRKCGCSLPSAHNIGFHLLFFAILIIDTKEVFGAICLGSCVCYPGPAAAGQRSGSEFASIFPWPSSGSLASIASKVSSFMETGGVS